MGGRGASSGISVSGKRYGTEYKTVLQEGNIKFLVMREDTSVTAPMETMTRNRVYVTVGKNGPKHITYYDQNNKRIKQIDLTHKHRKMQPHAHDGYEHNEFNGPKGARKLSTKERKMVERVNRIWYNRGNK